MPFVKLYTNRSSVSKFGATKRQQIRTASLKMMYIPLHVQIRWSTNSDHVVFHVTSSFEQAQTRAGHDRAARTHQVLTAVVSSQQQISLVVFLLCVN